LVINNSYTLDLTIVRGVGTGGFSIYEVTTSLNGASISHTYYFGDLLNNLTAINQVGLRFYTSESLAPSGGFTVNIDNFSATLTTPGIPEPATNAAFIGLLILASSVLAGKYRRKG
jgi:hypothetical protein